MLNLFGKKREQKVLVLYKFDTVETINESEFHELTGILFETIKKEDSFMYFSDLKYNDYDFEIFSKKMEKLQKKFNQLMSIIICDVNPIKENPNFQLYYSRSLNPTNLIFEFPKEQNIENVIKKMILFFNPVYGFIYETYQSKRSTNYALNGYTKEMPKIKGVKNFENPKGYFRKKIKKINEGFIREIFSYNVFSRKQLEKSLGRHTLKEFILQEKIGVLSQLNSNIYSWEMSDTELDKVKSLLADKNLFL